MRTLDAAALSRFEPLKDLAQETILRVLGQSKLPDLAKRTEFALCSTPMTIERETGARHGAITGWAHTNHPMPAVHEFGSIQKATETGVPDVLQCGMWTFSPAGLPVSIITGKLAADLVTGSAPLVDPAPFRFSRFSDGSKIEIISGF